MKIINWIKLLFSIVRNHKSVLNRLNYLLERINETDKLMQERTEFHADIHNQTDSQIIIIGRYRNRDYIKMYPIPDRNIKDVVNHLKSLSRHARTGRMDCIHPTMESCIKKEINA